MRAVVFDIYGTLFISGSGDISLAKTEDRSPAIVASRYGKGRMLLFSPNPVLGEEGAQHPEMFLDAIEWVDVSGKYDRKLGFEDVFDGVDPLREGRHEPTPEHAELAQTDATAE